MQVLPVQKDGQFSDLPRMWCLQLHVHRPSAICAEQSCVWAVIWYRIPCYSRRYYRDCCPASFLLRARFDVSYTDKITRKLAERKYWPLLKDAIPAHSSAAIVNCVYERLLILRQSSLDVFEPAEPSFTTDGPAGQTRSRLQTSSPSLVFNTAIGAVLPDETA